jgi:hypothetical protein
MSQAAPHDKGKPMTAQADDSERHRRHTHLLKGVDFREGAEALRQTVDELASREAIEDWLAMARKEWVSPL